MEKRRSRSNRSREVKLSLDLFKVLELGFMIELRGRLVLLPQPMVIQCEQWKEPESKKHSIGRWSLKSEGGAIQGSFGRTSSIGSSNSSRSSDSSIWCAVPTSRSSSAYSAAGNSVSSFQLQLRQEPRIRSLELQFSPQEFQSHHQNPQFLQDHQFRRGKGQERLKSEPRILRLHDFNGSTTQDIIRPGWISLNFRPSTAQVLTEDFAQALECRSEASI